MMRPERRIPRNGQELRQEQKRRPMTPTAELIEELQSMGRVCNLSGSRVTASMFNQAADRLAEQAREIESLTSGINNLRSRITTLEEYIREIDL